MPADQIKYLRIGFIPDEIDAGPKFVNAPVYWMFTEPFTVRLFAMLIGPAMFWFAELFVSTALGWPPPPPTPGKPVRFVTLATFVAVAVGKVPRRA